MIDRYYLSLKCPVSLDQNSPSGADSGGEIETAHLGYFGSQETFYVGNLKGVGRIYQQTYVNTYSKIAFTKLYTTKTPIPVIKKTLNINAYFYDFWFQQTYY